MSACFLKLKEILHTANKLHDHVTKPREHAADTELLQTLAASNLASAKGNLLTGKRLNTAKDLVTSLKCEYLRGWTPEQSSKTQVSLSAMCSRHPTLSDSRFFLFIPFLFFFSLPDGN